MGTDRLRPRVESGATTRRDAGPWWKKLLWFAAIWCASLVALSLVAYGIRAMIMP